ncbi:MAG: zinc ribbon domain-containing protein [Lachnospiraceae bacterium]|nr:zinc ribbon domain-containing protein [Lachnospiraceae bacterium]
MLIQCKYCGSNYSDTELECPNCGAANDCVNRTAVGAPKTISELLEWARRHHLPLDEMRTYIGQDVRTARAYGIYKDSASGDFVVYKNKSDGSRAERYRGKDEAYAVNELYQKIKARVAEQKAHKIPTADDRVTPSPVSQRNHGQKNMLHKIISMVVIWVAISLLSSVFFLCFVIGFSQDKLPYASSGYYRYGSDTYYHDYGDSWYIWNAASDTWSSYNADSEWDLFEDYDNYYEGYSYDEEYGASDWDEWYDDHHDSPSYDDDRDYDNDWDSDYDWDSGSDWDSGWDDWDSDW